MKFLAFAPLLVLLTGCLHLVRIQSPMEDLNEVTIVPVAARDFEDSKTWTNRLRDNLLRVSSVDRVVIMYGDDLTQPGPPAELPIAETSQALFRLRLLDFDNYYPPSASVEVDLYVPNAGNEDDEDSGLRLDERGSRSATVKLRPALHRMTFQIPVRADDPEVSRAIDMYALAQSDDDRGFDARDRIVWTTDRFIDFVAFYSIGEAFDRLEKNLRDAKRASARAQR